MNLIVNPGDYVGFLLKDPSQPVNDQPWKQVAVVQAVMTGALIVPEEKSRNGLAQIVCHANSETDGSYWYEFFRTDGTNTSWNVTALVYSSGQPIKERSFIVDWPTE